MSFCSAPLRLLLLLLTASASVLPVFAAPPEKIRYTVATDVPNKRFRITMTVEGNTEPNLSVAIPAWSPGWYVLTNAYKNVENVQAQDDKAQTLSVTHPDRLTWQVQTGGSRTIRISYDLKAIDQDPEVVGSGTGTLKDYGFFAPYLDETNGFVPGPASLLYVTDARQVPSQVTYDVPQGWRVASANTPTSDPFTFTAPDYDTLADQPADLGRFTRYDRTIAGVPVSVILVGAEGKQATRFVSACWKITEAGIRLFGGPPFPRYMYHFRFLSSSPSMMGLEHLNSTVISVPVSVLESTDLVALSIVAHEFVHAWNVKRIRPEKLGPFDYTREVRVKDLWWSEGVTDYYAPRVMVEAGLVTDAYWRAYIAEILTGVQNNPARKKVTLETASLKAWEGRSEGFGGLSYYEKGLLVGMLLDIEMRRLSDNRTGLDDLMKALLKQAEATGKGFADGEIERLAEQLTGKELTPFFDRALRSTEELDYNSILKAAGMRVEKVTVTVPDAGISSSSLTFAPEGLRVVSLPDDSVAGKAGLEVGDLITVVDGVPVARLSGAILGDKAPGETIRLSVKRENTLKNIEIRLQNRQETVYEMVRLLPSTPEQTAIYNAITGKKTGNGQKER